MTYKRILLKISGETVAGPGNFGIDPESCQKIAFGIKDLWENGFEVGVVIGAGNIFRGKDRARLGLKRIPADQMGMLATIINAIALQQAIEDLGAECVVMSAIECHQIAENYHWKHAIKHLEKNRIVLFAGGTANPYFTTDTAAALRANEIQADLLLKATKVNGIYSKDPIQFPDAIRYEKIAYSDVLAQRLEVMDPAAIALCMSAKMPILVCNAWASPKLSCVLQDTSLGTLVYYKE